MKKNSFTLIEILIVIAIIGILAAAAIPKFLIGQEIARVAEAKQLLGAIRESELSYFSSYRIYTNNYNSLAFAAGPRLTQDRANRVYSAYWTFIITGAPSTTTFTVTATRRSSYLGGSGATYSGRTITINVSGLSGGTHPYARSS